MSSGELHVTCISNDFATCYDKVRSDLTDCCVVDAIFVI